MQPRRHDDTKKTLSGDSFDAVLQDCNIEGEQQAEADFGDSQLARQLCTMDGIVFMVAFKAAAVACQ
jgi:hypothetical protein